MRANNKLKEVILGTLFYLLRFYPKKVKQCNTINIILRRTGCNENFHLMR